MKFDCIIVLANEMDENGNLNSESISRIKLACDSYFKNLAEVLVTCGWDYRNDSDLFIADAMKSYAMGLGVPANNILTETNSRDTVGDAFFTKQKILKPNKWENLLIITSDYHVERTSKIFQFIYGNDYNIEVMGAGCFDSDKKQLSEKKSIEAFNNTFANTISGDDSQIYDALSSKHPFYNGTIYPKI